ncbi:MAG: bile acid:sodium symporter [Planctomycetota bacterium]
MMPAIRLVETWFWAVCILAVLTGLFIPWAAPFGNTWAIRFFLGGILFFTGLKTDFRAAWRELSRPWLVIYVTAMVMVALPLALWGAARAVLPQFALGILIVAAMPAGMAGSSLTDIAGGNAALALVNTLATSLACPLITPWVIRFATGGAGEAGSGYLLGQSLFLAAILFIPTAAAFFVRRTFPGWVERRRGALTGLSILSLSFLIIGAMASVSADFRALAREKPAAAAGLFGFMFLFSAFFHLAGYWLAPWRPLADRAAISVSTAYVNNGMAVVFATTFFKETFGAAAVVPGIFLEIPMVLAILPLRAWVARKTVMKP